jgi:hypothetical protein
MHHVPPLQAAGCVAALTEELYGRSARCGHLVLRLRASQRQSSNPARATVYSIYSMPRHPAHRPCTPRSWQGFRTPLLVRFVAGERAYLSPSNGGPAVYINLEGASLAAAGGRPSGCQSCHCRCGLHGIMRL